MINLFHLFAAILFLFVFTSPILSSDNVLYSSDKLEAGESLTYKDYSLTIQRCNVVLTGPNNVILWQTYTAGKAAHCNLRLHSDGELILYGTYINSPFEALWSSGVKSEEGEYALVLNHDGSLKIYGKSIWSSPKPSLDYQKAPEPSKNPKIPVTDSTLWSGDIAPIGTIIVKDSYKLELGWTCNMTLTDTTSNLVSWHTNTTDTTRDCFVNLDRDGQLTIKYLGGANLWQNHAGSDWGQEYVLALRPQGLLTVYGPVIWSAKENFVGEANIAMVTAD